jgi:hypothetical protein
MGFGLATFTLIHVLISLAGIGSGFTVIYGMLVGKRLDKWTAVFLATTVATSATGFFFPFHGFKPSYVVGILSLLVLAAAIFARYSRQMAGGWRLAYVITSVIALYFNVFVLVVQAFAKLPPLKGLAPTQTEQPFKVAHLALLVIFVAVGVAASIRFRAGQLFDSDQSGVPSAPGALGG